MEKSDALQFHKMLKMAFEAYDQEIKGYLSIKQLRKFIDDIRMSLYQYKSDDKSYSKILEIIDSDKSNTIEQSEFVGNMQSVLPIICEIGPEMENEIKQNQENFGIGNDQYIVLAGFTYLQIDTCKRQGVAKPTEEHVSQIYRLVDKNEDKHVHITEFTDNYNEIVQQLLKNEIICKKRYKSYFSKGIFSKLKKFTHEERINFINYFKDLSINYAKMIKSLVKDDMNINSADTSAKLNIMNYVAKTKAYQYVPLLSLINNDNQGNEHHTLMEVGIESDNSQGCKDSEEDPKEDNIESISPNLFQRIHNAKVKKLAPMVREADTSLSNSRLQKSPTPKKDINQKKSTKSINFNIKRSVEINEFNKSPSINRKQSKLDISKISRTCNDLGPSKVFSVKKNVLNGMQSIRDEDGNNLLSFDPNNTLKFDRRRNGHLTNKEMSKSGIDNTATDNPSSISPKKLPALENCSFIEKLKKDNTAVNVNNSCFMEKMKKDANNSFNVNSMSNAKYHTQRYPCTAREGNLGSSNLFTECFSPSLGKKAGLFTSGKEYVSLLNFEKQNTQLKEFGQYQNGLIRGNFFENYNQNDMESLTNNMITYHCYLKEKLIDLENYLNSAENFCRTKLEEETVTVEESNTGINWDGMLKKITSLNNTKPKGPSMENGVFSKKNMMEYAKNTIKKKQNTSKTVTEIALEKGDTIPMTNQVSLKQINPDINSTTEVNIYDKKSIGPTQKNDKTDQCDSYRDRDLSLDKQTSCSKQPVLISGKCCVSMKNLDKDEKLKISDGSATKQVKIKKIDTDGGLRNVFTQKLNKN